jgi:hypothetical protein
MQFLRRNQYLLLTLAVLLFASVMTVQQFLANQSAHVQRVEDFILLHERGETKLCEQRYQRIVQELPALSDRALVDDWQRTVLLVDPKTPQLDNLLWKYHVSVNNELRRRADKRLKSVLQQAEVP